MCFEETMGNFLFLMYAVATEGGIVLEKKERRRSQVLRETYPLEEEEYLIVIRHEGEKMMARHFGGCTEHILSLHPMNGSSDLM